MAELIEKEILERVVRGEGKLFKMCYGCSQPNPNEGLARRGVVLLEDEGDKYYTCGLGLRECSVSYAVFTAEYARKAAEIAMQNAGREPRFG